ncbi:MAG: hypothetical protein ACFFB0_00470 [Promethearchaeota archaeon]
MKDEKIEMKREVWDYLRSYRNAHFQEKYLEKERIKGTIEIKRQNHQFEVNN